ncbi:MAG: mercury resistance system periplasmic binding protein MerP [Proteobacteria bacterium]|nr:mercury resistance system periplasmic binding protein MerP [Pseudomonadota bacterium]
MKKPFAAAAIAAAILINGHALAAQRSVTLAVAGMTCVSCPYIVKQTLAGISGVNTVEVSFKEKKATVTYDDGKTSIAALTAATANVGFPSRVIE